MKSKKQLLAFLLSLAMIFSLFPAAAFADDGTAAVSEEAVVYEIEDDAQVSEPASVIEEAAEEIAEPEQDVQEEAAPAEETKQEEPSEEAAEPAEEAPAAEPETEAAPAEAEEAAPAEAEEATPVAEPEEVVEVQPAAAEEEYDSELAELIANGHCKLCATILLEAAAATEELPESAHNYESNTDHVWVIESSAAPNGLYVSFDAQTMTEAGYDFIYIYNGQDEELGKYSGSELAGATLFVPASTVKIRLTSDSSQNRWGFKVTAVESAGATIDLAKVGKVDEISPVFVNEEPAAVVRVNGNAIAKDTDYTVEYDSSTTGEKTLTITGKGSYSGTLTAAFTVVDDDSLMDGATVTENQISLRQSGDEGRSYVSVSGSTTAWANAIESVTLAPVEADGETATVISGAEYPKAPKEITLTKEDLTPSGNYLYFKRTAEEPVVYVMLGHDPIDITRWGSTLTYPQSQKYKVTIKAKGYKDSTGIVTYYTGGNPEFKIIIDADGDDATTDDRTVAKSYTFDDIRSMATYANGSSQCGMTGFRTFSGMGVSLEDLLKDAGVTVSDDDYFMIDTTDQYGVRNKTYDELFGVNRYFMSPVYEDEDFKEFYNDLVSQDSESGSIIELRRYLAAKMTDADIVKPRINVDYVETMISGDQVGNTPLPTADNVSYNSLVSEENAFRFFYGIQLVQEDVTVTFDSQGGNEVPAQTVKSHLMTSTENTTMRSSYWSNSLVIYRGAGAAYKPVPSTAADRITVPENPTLEGKVFLGWYTDAEGTEKFNFNANDGTVDENTTLYAKWEDAGIIDSDHDYANNEDKTYTYTFEGEAANGVIVTFGENTSTEKNYDFIYILDAEDNEVGKYSGKELAGKEIYVPTKEFKIRLTSDRSGTDYGFKVTKVEANGDTIDLSRFAKIGKIDAVAVNGTPSVSVSVNGKALEAGKDYTLSADTSAAGVVKATITGTGDYSGTVEKDFLVYAKAIRITDYTITNAEHDDADGELNQTIIATITFDSEIQMTAEDLSDELYITVAGGDVRNTARDVTYSIKGNKLTITMVSTDWVAIYNGVLAISESENGLFDLKGTEDGSYVVWDTQSDNIPIGIVVENDVTEGTADAAATTTAKIRHKANMRGMYHFQLVSIVNGEETVIGQSTSHAHAFYTSITKEAIAKAMATAINGYEGYTTTYEDGSDSFVITADTAVEGQTLAVRMFENKATINYKYKGIEFVSPSGKSYMIAPEVVEKLATNEVARWGGATETAAYFKDVLAEIGAAEDLGDCSYVLAAADGYSATLRAEWYENYGLYMDGEKIRFVLMDSSLVQGGWYSPAPLATITAKNHSYGEEGTCENLISVGKGKTEACAEESATSFLGANGESFVIPASVVKKLAAHEVKRWKDVTVTAAYLKDVLAEVGAEESLGECCYTFTADDGYSVALRAEWYENFGLYMEGGRARLVLMDSTLAQGGWYSPAPLATIEAKNHVHGEHGICDNKINLSKNEKEDCGANTHVAGEAVQETVAASYTMGEHIDSVVYCTICSEELERTVGEETGKNLKEQAEDAAAAYEAAKEAAEKETGANAVAAAEAALEAAEAAKEAADAAYTSAKAEGVDEATLAEAELLVEEADLAVNEAMVILAADQAEADAAADLRDDAVATLAQLNDLVDSTLYTASTYAVYNDAYTAFKALVLDDSATSEQIRSARTGVTRAYTNLVLKGKQTLTSSTKSGSKGYAALAKAKATFKLLTVKGNKGKLTYTKSSGSAYATVNKTTGAVTLKKGTPAGTYSIKIKAAAAATDDYLAASKTVTVKVVVSKAAQPMTAKAVAKTAAFTKVKSGKVTVSGGITVKKAQGTVTYTKASGSKYLTIAKSTGKITVAKGTPKGTYKIKVKVKAAGNKNYKAGTKTVTVTVKVK